MALQCVCVCVFVCAMINYTMRVIVHVETCLTEYLSKCWNFVLCFCACFFLLLSFHTRKKWTTFEHHVMSLLRNESEINSSQKGSTLKTSFFTFSTRFTLRNTTISKFSCFHFGRLYNFNISHWNTRNDLIWKHIYIMSINARKHTHTHTNHFPFSKKKQKKMSVNGFRQPFTIYALHFCIFYYTCMQCCCFLSYGSIIWVARRGQWITDTSVNTKYRIIRSFRNGGSIWIDCIIQTVNKNAFHIDIFNMLDFCFVYLLLWLRFTCWLLFYAYHYKNSLFSFLFFVHRTQPLKLTITHKSSVCFFFNSFGLINNFSTNQPEIKSLICDIELSHLLPDFM